MEAKEEKEPTVKTKVISCGSARREVVDIEPDINPGRHGKKTSTTHHERFVGGEWRRRAGA